MSQWISYIKNMASQLREVGVDVSTERVSNHILNGLGKEYQGLRYGLKARAGPLRVEVVIQMLLAVEMELREEKESAANVSSNMKTSAYQGANTAVNYATQANPSKTAFSFANTGDCLPIKRLRRVIISQISYPRIPQYRYNVCMKVLPFSISK